MAVICHSRHPERCSNPSQRLRQVAPHWTAAATAGAAAGTVKIAPQWTAAVTAAAVAATAEIVPRWIVEATAGAAAAATVEIAPQ